VEQVVVLQEMVVEVVLVDIEIHTQKVQAVVEVVNSFNI
jgi:hypothetical protein